MRRRHDSPHQTSLKTTMRHDDAPHEARQHRCATLTIQYCTWHDFIRHETKTKRQNIPHCTSPVLSHALWCRGAVSCHHVACPLVSCRMPWYRVPPSDGSDWGFQVMQEYASSPFVCLVSYNTERERERERQREREREIERERERESRGRHRTGLRHDPNEEQGCTKNSVTARFSN